MTGPDDTKASVLDDPRLVYLRDGMMGRDSEILLTFGRKRCVYFDYIASGLPFAPIEKMIAERILPQMANTHTENNSSGRQITFHVENAYNTISRAVGATEDDVLIFVGAGATSSAMNWNRAVNHRNGDANHNSEIGPDIF